jgi:hypothetical protein
MELLSSANAFLLSRQTILPPFQWELTNAAALGLSHDQLRFTIALALTVPAGLGLRFLRNPTGAPHAGSRRGRRGGRWAAEADGGHDHHVRHLCARPSHRPSASCPARPTMPHGPLARTHLPPHAT